MIMDFINYGPEIYKMILFACLSITNTGRICEHDLYALMESFKPRDDFYRVRDLISANDIPTDFKDKMGDTDQIFFQAFSTDILKLANSINLRKSMNNISEEDSRFPNKEIDNAVNVKNESEDVNDENMVNDIDYLIGTVLKRGHCGHT